MALSHHKLANKNRLLHLGNVDLVIFSRVGHSPFVVSWHNEQIITKRGFFVESFKRYKSHQGCLDRQYIIFTKCKLYDKLETDTDSQMHCLLDNRLYVPCRDICRFKLLVQ